MWFSSSPIGKFEARQSEFELLHAHWLRYVPTRAATAIARAGCRSVQEIAEYGRDRFLRQSNTGLKTVESLSRLLSSVDLAFADDRLTPQAAIARTLAMTITDAAEAQEVAKDCVSSLIKAGFVISVHRMTEPGGTG